MAVIPMSFCPKLFRDAWQHYLSWRYQRRSSRGERNTQCRPQILLSANTAWNVWNYRSGLVRALQELGYDITVVGACNGYGDKVRQLGCRFEHIDISGPSINPLTELKVLFRFIRIFWSGGFSFYFGFTIKPNIYGSLAAHLFGVPVVNNIAGLGAAFARPGLINFVASILYGLALRRSRWVFFQNMEDRELFVKRRLVSALHSSRLPGSGVDLAKFKPSPRVDRTGVRFLFIGRVLWDKGIGEFVEAARLLRAEAVGAEFCILGFLDSDNPSAVSRRQMEEWVRQGAIRYLGACDDVRPAIAASDCIVLPSYYGEGVPRCLLEAAAMARPIITTDSVGCRDAIEDGKSGLLCKPRDVHSLMDKMRFFIGMEKDERMLMGEAGNARVGTMFDENIVIGEYLRVICGDRAQVTGVCRT